VILRSGSLRVSQEAGQRICHVTGKVLVSGKRVRTDTQTCDVLAGGFYFRHLSTEFLIDARGIETSLFVIEGSVDVFSEDAADPERQVVAAGEWLVTRKGEPIPKPKRYRRTDAESGSSLCLYSWCRQTRVIDIEPPDFMRELIPPPPNPPGRQ
jgi:ferric-dicitrate binding protein FerR (iron transport regulator)